MDPRLGRVMLIFIRVSGNWLCTISAMAEWQAIEDLHVQTEGRLQTFVFLEPGNNLLSWSETLADPMWTKDAGITTTDSQADPLGGTRGGKISNSGGVGGVSQGFAMPASYRYAGSVWARTASAGASLEVSDGATQVVSVGFDSTNQWKRHSRGLQPALGARDGFVSHCGFRAAERLMFTDRNWRRNPRLRNIRKRFSKQVSIPTPALPRMFSGTGRPA